MTAKIVTAAIVAVGFVVVTHSYITSESYSNESQNNSQIYSLIKGPSTNYSAALSSQVNDQTSDVLGLPTMHAADAETKIYINDDTENKQVEGNNWSEEKAAAAVARNVEIEAAAEALAKIMIVESGSTLTTIAAENQTTYERLYDANEQIDDPDIIKPGQSIRIPAPEEQLVSRPIPANASEAVTTSLAKSATSSAASSASQISVQAALPVETVDGGVWDRLARCESGGNWSIDSGNGYYGGLQFSVTSWRGVGGSGSPANASKADQISRAEILLARQGWGAWPACTSKLGLR